MSSQQGWITLNRKIVENPMWLSEPFSRSHAWIDLILLANHKPNFFFIRDIKIDVKRGELARGENALAERWSWSRSKVRNFLKLLEKEQQIILKKSKVINRIEIVNYDKYQDNNNSKYNSKTSEGTTEKHQKAQQKNINNNDNNDNNDNNIPDWIPKEPWKEFMKVREKLKAKNSDYAKKVLINSLAKMKEQGHCPTDIINTSILNSWKGVFAPNNINQKNNQPKPTKSKEEAKKQLQALMEIKT